MAVETFLGEDFLLHSKSARLLYHDYACRMPILDYHCHLPPDQVAGNRKFDNYAQVALHGDHYKWRAMRTYGIPESDITGPADDITKFRRWAETVPHTMRNPLFHWTHMELAFPFGIRELLNPATANGIYHKASDKLQQPEFSVQGILNQFQVRLLCTTDDPADDLQYHLQHRNADPQTHMLPTFRPDKAMQVGSPKAFRDYIGKLQSCTSFEIRNLNSYTAALKARHDYFHEMGCRLSDHGLETIAFVPFTDGEVSRIFDTLFVAGTEVSAEDQRKFESFMLVQFALWDHLRGWTQQFHLGAIRNNNSRMLRALGPDTGFDSIGDFSQVRSMARFFDFLDKDDCLARTIIYNLNPADNEAFATMIGNFNDGSIKGKMQFGSAWWFLDQKDGMEKQINALSNLGLLSQFVGMLTDSRSFLSYSRHEYFRRILCNLIGKDIEKGELPQEYEFLGSMIQDICYRNAVNYFGFESLKTQALSETH
jgi:glucuronate isomerase